jgi:hypothetical protein
MSPAVFSSQPEPDGINVFRSVKSPSSHIKACGLFPLSEDQPTTWPRSFIPPAALLRVYPGNLPILMISSSSQKHAVVNVGNG